MFPRDFSIIFAFALVEPTKALFSSLLINLRGDLKVGDLSGIQVFKYKHKTQLYLIAYEYIDDKLILTFIEHGTHENFYRDLKKR
mgnify:CR=1 FL=1